MSTTWSRTAPLSAKAILSSASEVAPTSTDGTDGIALDGADEKSTTVRRASYNMDAFSFFVEAASGNLSADTAVAYLYNPITSTWAPAPALNIPIAGGSPTEGHQGYVIPAAYSGLRLAYLVAQAATIYINGMPRLA